MTPAISQLNTPYATIVTQFAGDKPADKAEKISGQDAASTPKGDVKKETVTGDDNALAKELAELKAQLAELKAAEKTTPADKVEIKNNKGLGNTAAKAALKTTEEVLGSYKDVKLLQRPFAFLYPARLKKAFNNTREYYKSLSPEDKLRSWVGVAWQVLVDTTMGALTFGVWQGAQLFAQGLHSSSLIRRFYAEVMTDYNDNRKAKKEESPKPAEPTETKADNKK